MKRTDVAMIILIASVSILIAFFATKALFGGAANESVKVKTIDPISSTIKDPDPAIFNKNAINPTVGVGVQTEPSK